MRFFRSMVGLFLLTASARAATVNYIQTSVNDADGSTIGAVSSNQYLDTAIPYSTVTAPSTFSTYRFTHWTNSSDPSTVYRDAWGRSQNPISFVLLEDTTVTAHYLPEARDLDEDEIPDWYEIEHFGNLDRDQIYDGDEDDIALLTEFTGGTHPLYNNAQQAGGVAYADSDMVTFNRAVYPTYTLRSEPVGTVNESAVVAPGTVITSPNLTQTTFGYWTVDGVPQRDAWGVALRQISFTMNLVNREAVAWFFDEDSDDDNLPDAWEWFYLGTTSHDGSAILRGDGITLLQNYEASRAPTFAYAFQTGGVAWADSEMVTVNLADFSRYTLSSAPSGVVDQTAVVADGTVITTPEITEPTFGYWELDGVPQRDAWGVALRQISFTVSGTDRTAVAHLFANDSDGDDINDGYEYYHLGTLVHDETYDGDGDEVLLLAEYLAGSNPVYGNATQAGGVSWADSETVVVNLQPYERLTWMQVNGVLTEFFSPNPQSVSGIDFGSWSSTAVSDWDRDGDFDLFVASEEGLQIFRNIGTPNNPNFAAITSGFPALTAFIGAIDRPSIVGGDWNGDGFGDLVIGGQTGTLRFIASSGAFSSNANGSDLVTGSTSARPALGDMNDDGRADLLVLLADGTVKFYLNDGSAMPFSGSGTANFLGTPAPSGTSIAVGDVNQDGRPDVLLSDEEGRIWEFLRQADGSFLLKSKVWGGSYPGYASGLTLAAVDLEGDGDLDLIGGLANGGIIALRDPNVGRPTGLIARPGANSVQLDWNANWQSRIRGYYIYRATAAAGPWTKLENDSVPLPSYLDSPVDQAVLNHYYVSGVSYFFLPGNSEPRMVESLPSELAIASAGKVILSVPPVRGNPGNLLKIKLSIENAMGVSGENMQVRVAYDPAKLIPWAQAQVGGDTVIDTGLSRNLIYTDNGTTATGELIINGSGGTMEPGSGMFFALQFKVNPAVPNGSSLGVSISGATMRDLSGNALTVEIIPLDVPDAGDDYMEGDLNGDGLVSNADKELLKDLTKPNSRPPTANELMAGDLNGNGSLDVKDLVLLLQLLNSP